MNFQFDVPDEVVTSVNSWLNTQVSVQPDPDTGNPAFKPNFADIHEYFETVLLNACKQAAVQFPSPALRAQLIAARQADLAFTATIKPVANRAASVDQSQSMSSGVPQGTSTPAATAPAVNGADLVAGTTPAA